MKGRREIRFEEYCLLMGGPHLLEVRASPQDLRAQTAKPCSTPTFELGQSSILSLELKVNI